MNPFSVLYTLQVSSIDSLIWRYQCWITIYWWCTAMQYVTALTGIATKTLIYFGKKMKENVKIRSDFARKTIILIYQDRMVVVVAMMTTATRMYFLTLNWDLLSALLCVDSFEKLTDLMKEIKMTHTHIVNT